MAIAVVAHTVARSGDGNNVTTGGIDTTGASLLVVGVATFGGSGTLSDSKGNTWTALTQYGSSDATVRLYYCENPTVGAGHTFTVAATGKSPSVSILALSGAAAASAFDVQNGSGIRNSQTTVQPGSVSPSEDNEIVITATSGYSGAISSIDGGFTISDSAQYNSTGMSIGLAYLVQTSAAAANPTWTWATNSVIIASIATFKQASGGGGDVTAPTLSSASGTATSDTEADLSVTTDEDNGTLYAVVTTSSTKPSAAQVKAGQDHTGSAAAFDDSQAISSTGAKTFNATGLSASTAYYAHFMHEDAATNQSSVATSAQFTTDETAVAPDQPTISAGTPSSTGVTLTSSAFADDNAGDTHAASQWQVTTAADTTYASPVISTGDDATNKTSYAATGLDPETDYIARVRHKDSSGLYSDWSTDASFTTAAGLTAGTLSEDSQTNSSVTVSWTAATSNTGTVAEQLQRSDDGSTGWTDVTGATSSPATVNENPVFLRVAYTDDIETVYSNTLEVADETLPLVTLLRIRGDVLTVFFSEAVSGDLAGLSFTASGGALTITGDDTITAATSVSVQLSRTPATDETITADYSDVTGTITDAATNELASFAGTAVIVASNTGSAARRFQLLRP